MLTLAYEACSADINLRKKLNELLSMKSSVQLEINKQENPLKKKEYQDALGKIDELIGKIRFHSIDVMNIMGE